MQLVKYEAARGEKECWIKEARKQFIPGFSEPCFICGKYQGITHAHHIIPLSEQYDSNYTFPDQDFEWLCPNHHAIVHKLMSKKPYLIPFKDLEDAELRALLCFIDIEPWGLFDD